MCNRFLFSLAMCGALLPTLWAQDRPNFVWVTCEDMSPFLGVYGDEFATTPHLDRFAESAIRYTNAWSNMPICAPARSTIVTGCYATSLGTMNLRSIVPQSPTVKPLPVLMRENGYYATNRHKTDYNFSHIGLWDESSQEAHWRNRPDPDQPFFHVVNYQQTHEGPTNSQSLADNHTAIRHDPRKVPVPVYLPDTAKVREILAHHYDLITSMDDFFGRVLADLEADGLAEDTIVFFYSDHGAGFPRYKRWLYETGLKVPLMVHIPEKFQRLAPQSMGATSDNLVGFVDLASTVLELAGIERPAFLQGRPFLGAAAKQNPEGQPYLYGARDRADDIEDLSRCIRDDRYLYIRHYMPFRPYIRPAAIFSPNKGLMGEVIQDYSSFSPNPQTQVMFAPKAREELYDLQADPLELNNLADDPAYAEIKARLHAEMRAWLLDIRDAAFLPEGEMMRRAAHSSVYDMAQDPYTYDLEAILAAAEKSSHPDTTLEELAAMAKARDNAVRYWAACGLLGRKDDSPLSMLLLESLMHDRNPSVATVAAEAILTIDPERRDALDLLIEITSEHIESEPAIALRSARALAEVGSATAPVLPEVQALLKRVDGPVWNRYRNWYYPMFIGMSLDQVQMNNGIRIARYE